MAVRLFDPLEMDLPDLGLVTMQDAETGEQLVVDTHDAGFRKRFGGAPSGARASCARPRRAPASTPSSSPPTTIWSTSILRFADLRKRRSRLANWSGGRYGVPSHVRPAA